ncbi:DNA-binding transcriptional MerR regulator [Rhizomicrobium palustre]|uniref:DNA-binding transcriptional MerR regulator n=1 Tax=Rhizomicrobium palustre TaxID=189966 RepID=A0A846N471_9PROT|nr:helix-turn-helix domain-containing protein [Rhizomicrobium palustre]NIK89850.1 DNA-binding transcriptional MerR regulator [Rhizomicrobium palustre]
MSKKAEPRDYAIGDLSRETGVKVTTIRYYESIGLLAEPPRSEGGRRMYGAAHLRRLKFIRHARDLGFEVDAIREMLALSDEPDKSCARVDAITRQHLLAVEDKISRLTLLRNELSRMMKACRHGRVSECRILDTLADHGRCESGHGALRV